MSRCGLFPASINHVSRMMVLVAIILGITNALNIGGYELNFGVPKSSPAPPSKEFLSLNGFQVQSVSTGAFMDSGEILKSKSSGPTLLVVCAPSLRRLLPYYLVASQNVLLLSEYRKSCAHMKDVLCMDYCRLRFLSSSVYHVYYHVYWVQALTHYGDFNSWEMAQQLKYNLPRFADITSIL